MRLVIAGSRTLSPGIAEVDSAVAAFRMMLPAERRDVAIVEVVCGDAPGSDNAGAAWAVTYGVDVHHEPITKADIEEHGAYLGPKMRNRRMAERGDGAVIFWDGKSGGSADMCIRMVARGKPVLVVPMRSRRGRRR